MQLNCDAREDERFSNKFLSLCVSSSDTEAALTHHCHFFCPNLELNNVQNLCNLALSLAHGFTRPLNLNLVSRELVCVCVIFVCFVGIFVSGFQINKFKKTRRCLVPNAIALQHILSQWRICDQTYTLPDFMLALKGCVHSIGFFFFFFNTHSLHFVPLCSEGTLRLRHHILFMSTS